MTTRHRLAWFAIGLFCLAPARADRRRADDPEERAERLELGRRTFTENCLICHGDEMVAQQRLTPAQWKAEVVKMVGWGAPLPEEETGRLLDYLNTSYPADAKPADPIPVAGREATVRFRASAPAPPAAGQVDRGGPLYAQHCATCHGQEARGGDLGQNLVLNRALLDIPGCLAVIRDGRRRMPGFSMVLGEREASDILAWLRARPLDPK
ncbi:MAG: cytochrome c [Isosphaeraceae bacterium]